MWPTSSFQVGTSTLYRGTATCSAQRQRVQYRPPEQRMPPYQPSWQVTQRRHVRTIRSSSPSVASASAASGSATAPSVSHLSHPARLWHPALFLEPQRHHLVPLILCPCRDQTPFAGTSAEPDSVGATSPRRSSLHRSALEHMREPTR